jgi:hypothetical protein
MKKLMIKDLLITVRELEQKEMAHIAGGMGNLYPVTWPSVSQPTGFGPSTPSTGTNNGGLTPLPGVDLTPPGTDTNPPAPTPSGGTGPRDPSMWAG